MRNRHQNCEYFANGESPHLKEQHAFLTEELIRLSALKSDILSQFEEGETRDLYLADFSAREDSLRTRLTALELAAMPGGDFKVAKRMLIGEDGLSGKEITSYLHQCRLEAEAKKKAKADPRKGAGAGDKLKRKFGKDGRDGKGKKQKGE